MKKAKYFVFCLVLFAVVSVYLNITTSLDYNIWGKIVGVRKNEEIIYNVQKNSIWIQMYRATKILKGLENVKQISPVSDRPSEKI